MKGPFNWKVKMYCPTCMGNVRVVSETDKCPECGSGGLKTIHEMMKSPTVPLYVFKKSNH